MTQSRPKTLFDTRFQNIPGSRLAIETWNRTDVPPAPVRPPLVLSPRPTQGRQNRGPPAPPATSKAETNSRFATAPHHSFVIH
jgi:hypothetical protein